MNKHNELIRIDVDTDVFISKEVYGMVLETLVKYILYTCQQIPVQIDVLEKEIAKWKDNSFEESKREKYKNKRTEIPFTDTRTNDVQDNVRTQIQQKVFRRKEEQAKRMFERNRQRWLSRIQNFTQTYNSTISSMKREVHNEDVRSTLFSLGPSPLTPKLVFRVFAPSDPENTSRTSSSLSDDKDDVASSRRKILLCLFRSFANNADLSALTSETFTLSKLWTMLEMKMKKERAPGIEESRLIPRHEFKVPPRAKVIEVYLKSKKTSVLSPSLAEMVLTPCVGMWGDTPKPTHDTRGNRAIVSLFSKVTDELHNEEESDWKIEPLTGESPSSFLVPSVSTVSVSPQKSSCILPSTAGFSCTQLPCPKTPYQHSADLVAMIETPVASKLALTPSPIKKLAHKINDFSLTTPAPSNSNGPLLWHQVEGAIHGFKDMYLSPG